MALNIFLQSSFQQKYSNQKNWKIKEKNSNRSKCFKPQRGQFSYPIYQSKHFHKVLILFHVVKVNLLLKHANFLISYLPREKKRKRKGRRAILYHCIASLFSNFFFTHFVSHYQIKICLLLF